MLVTLPELAKWAIELTKAYGVRLEMQRNEIKVRNYSSCGVGKTRSSEADVDRFRSTYGDGVL
jgi:hypothetical protein